MAMTGPSLRTVYAFWNSAILIDRLQVWVPVFGGGGGVTFCFAKGTFAPPGYQKTFSSRL
jgi:hypothetical protein